MTTGRASVNVLHKVWQFFRYGNHLGESVLYFLKAVFLYCNDGSMQPYSIERVHTVDFYNLRNLQLY